MVNKKEFKRRLNAILQEQRDILEWNSGVILDQEQKDILEWNSEVILD